MGNRSSSPKVAVVTGGAQGIGKAITLHLLEEGYEVIVADIDKEAGTKLARAYEKIYSVRYCETDVSDPDSVQKLHQFVNEHYGRLDALVNNAAIASAENVPLQEMALEEWDDKIRTNLTGPFLCSKYFAAVLEQSQGAIVNVASTRALMSEPNTEAYSASKGGVIALTHSLANTLGPEIRVNAVSPGWIDVRGWQKDSDKEVPDLRKVDHTQHPVGRVGQPTDVAYLVSFLISERAQFITGQNIVIDGGMTRKMIYKE